MGIRFRDFTCPVGLDASCEALCRQHPVLRLYALFTSECMANWLGVPGYAA